MMLAPLRSNSSRKAVVRPATIPPPVEGWDASSALAAMKPARAVQLKNWFPQPGWVEMRRGYKYHAWGINSASTSVESLMVWNGPSTQKMFAAGGGKIYDATSNAAATSAVTSLTGNRWQHLNMTTAAGHFLVIANGSDAVRNYNGSAWSTPTINNVTSSDLIHVNLHKKRLWFVEKDSTKAWYLDTDAISGDATSFEVGSNFDQGGYLVAMVTWTVDGGSGPDDMAVFISSRGQIAVYQGIDPSSALTWDLVGVYNLGAPLGRRCTIKYGTAPLIVTQSGILQMALSLRREQAELTASALTARINKAMNDSARSYGSLFGWEMLSYAKGTKLILNVPTAENESARQYVMNTLTGAWCEFDNHNANCWAVLNDNLYFGGNEGKVYKADTGCADIDTPITGIGQCAYQAFKSPGNLKKFSMLLPLVTVSGASRPSVGISTDFVETSSLSTPSGATPDVAQWDVAEWDQAKWAGGDQNLNDWTSTPALGRFASVKFRATTGTGVGGSAWGVSTWGESKWGSSANSEQTVRVNGFVSLYEPGAYV